MESLSPLPEWACDPPARALIDALGPGARFVGGCVRDALTGTVPVDLDVGVPYPPEETIARLARAGLKSFPTGIAHGTITARAQGRSFEVTSLRRDAETFGRHARVEFGADWREDAARRDFTINALSMAPDGALFDYFGGRDDLARGRVRFIGGAAARIGEDYLRILRFFRFHARFARGDFDPEALDAVRARAGRLSELSAERVRAEMFRLIEGPRAPEMLDGMRVTGALAHWLPEADEPGIARLAALRGAEARTGAAPDAIRALACFPLDAKSLAARWRLSNAEAARLARLRAPPVRLAAAMDARARARAFYASGEDATDRALLDAPEFFAAAKDWRRPVFPVTGADLIAAGMAPGPALGRVLERLETFWIESDFAAPKEKLLAEAVISRNP
jgi:poly(A) polymerase